MVILLFFLFLRLDFSKKKITLMQSIMPTMA